MKTKAIIIAALFSAFHWGYASPDIEITYGVHIQNLTEKNQSFRINGLLKEVSPNAAYFYPCTKGELVEFEFNAELSMLDCGTIKELQE